MTDREERPLGLQKGCCIGGTPGRAGVTQAAFEWQRGVRPQCRGLNLAPLNYATQDRLANFPTRYSSPRLTDYSFAVYELTHRRIRPAATAHPMIK